MAALRGCIEKLPERGREMIKLRYSLGISCREVASRIGQTVGGVKMAMVRLRGALHGCIKARLAEE